MIDRDEAIAIARKRAEGNAWSFTEPVAIVYRSDGSDGSGRFEIETNAGCRGTKARFVIDAATGQVISEGYIPR